MSVNQSLVISSQDFERLDHLLSSFKGAGLANIEALRGELARAQVVEPKDMPAEVVTMNSRAELLNESTGKARVLTLVYPKDADGKTDKVSVLAPVGSALLGLRAGQSIDWRMPSGQSERLKVLKVTYQPEAAGQYYA